MTNCLRKASEEGKILEKVAINDGLPLKGSSSTGQRRGHTPYRVPQATLCISVPRDPLLSVLVHVVGALD